MVPQIVYQEIEKIVYVEKIVPIIEIQERIRTIEVKVPEIIIQEKEVIKVVEIPSRDTIEVLKPYEVEKLVPLIETKVEIVDRTKTIDKLVTLKETINNVVEVDRLIEKEKLVTFVDRQDRIKEVEVNNYIDRVEYLEKNHETIILHDKQVVVREKDTEVKEVRVDVPYKVTEIQEVNNHKKILFYSINSIFFNLSSNKSINFLNCFRLKDF